MNEITTQSSTNEVTEFVPGHAVVNGKTSVERKLSVLNGATYAASVYLVSEKGKVGAAARHQIAAGGVQLIGKAARQGAYKPLAEALAVVLGESIIISNRASFDSLPDRLAERMSMLKDSGFKLNKDNVQVKTAKRVALDRACALVAEVQEIAASL